MRTFWQYLEAFSGTVPGVMQFNKEPGQRLVGGESEGICVDTQCKALDYLRKQGLPAYKVYIHAPSPAGDYPILHHIAVTEDEQGNFYIFDDPQSNFMGNDTTYDWIEVPENKLPITIRAILLRHPGNPLEAFKDFAGVSFKNGVWEANHDQDAVRYSPSENKWWYRKINNNNLWFTKKTFDPQFIPLTHEAVMQAYKMSDREAQSTIRTILASVFSKQGYGQAHRIFSHKGHIPQGNRDFVDKHYYDA